MNKRMNDEKKSLSLKKKDKVLVFPLARLLVSPLTLLLASANI